MLMTMMISTPEGLLWNAQHGVSSCTANQRMVGRALLSAGRFPGYTTSRATDIVCSVSFVSHT